MGLINNSVTLEYNYNKWKKLFNNEKKLLNSIFKKSFRIDHVGSTAIKGLIAKPIVDIIVGVNSFDELDEYMSELKKHYIIKNNFDYNEILLIKENENETFFLIHILIIEDSRYKNMIEFRDILSNNMNVLKKYEELKIKLAKKYSKDRKSYTKYKSNFIKKILKTYHSNINNL